MFVYSGDFFSSSWFLQEKKKSYKQNFKFEEGGENTNNYASGVNTDY